MLKQRKGSSRQCCLKYPKLHVKYQNMLENYYIYSKQCSLHSISQAYGKSPFGCTVIISKSQFCFHSCIYFNQNNKQDFFSAKLRNLSLAKFFHFGEIFFLHEPGMGLGLGCGASLCPLCISKSIDSIVFKITWHVRHPKLFTLVIITCQS